MSEDRQLVADVLARLPGAFERLVERYQKLVWHLVFRMVQHPEDTRELSQEVFLRVHQRLQQFRFDSALGTWIGRIAFNIAARHLQRKRIPLVEPHDGDDAGEDPVNRISDDFDLETACADADLMHKVATELERLPPLQRTIVTLFHLDELSVAEIALMMDMPAGTIKSHLFRARLQLRMQLETTAGEPA